MTETWWQAVKRRHRNIQNAKRGIDEYIDEHGHRYVGLEVEEFLNGDDV